MKVISVVCVDFQNDFASPGGVGYRDRPCVDFITGEVIPYFRRLGLRMAEIVSDYRLPRPGDEFECCVPGTWGYESVIPADVKAEPIWVKCMNSPEWVRENGGRAGMAPGLPYPNPSAFSTWLRDVIGPPDQVDAVVVMGLTLDCCVLCTGQVLSFRGYPVRFLVEGTDTFSGDPEQKSRLLKVPLSNWGAPLEWGAFMRTIEAP